MCASVGVGGRGRWHVHKAGRSERGARSYVLVERVGRAGGHAEKVNKANGWEIGIHVDGASGAFVAPFIFPDFKFDFRLKNVVSINVSGHKWASLSC
jgi:glutamate/tyrosine decarboxylase-like PLP-dependent enzyme